MGPRAAGLGLAAGLAAAGCVIAQVPPDERIPITDPDRLERLGFSRDAKNVFAWSKMDRVDPSGLDISSKATETWGTQVGYSTVYGYQLQSTAPSIVLGKSLGTDTICFDNPTTNVVDSLAQIPVPEGARLGVFRSWSYDSDPDQDLILRVWESCEAYGTDPPTHTLLTETSTLGSPGSYPGTKDLGGLTVNNRACAYSVQVVWALYPQNCAGTALRVRKLQFTWVRQVSPGPATPTFGDVPKNHQFYQFVEALARSGVTLGCGGGDDFCPDSPVTRGQMAAFLARALGLQWP